MDEKKFLTKKFREYYYQNKQVYTEQLNKREIGFIPFEGTMIRHRKVEDLLDLQNFLMDNIPRHLYHSVAYYKYPDKRSMQEKEWNGAEYVFDLDADHIPGADQMSYEQILREVKDHTLRLLNKFLIGYLDLDPESLNIYFSGARGYHIHIKSDKIYQMNSDQRREISNLVRGEGISIKSFLGIASKTPITGKGWISDINSELIDTLNKIAQGEKTEYVDRVGEDKIKQLLDRTISAKDKRKYRQIYMEQGIEKYSNSNIKMIENLLEKIISEYVKKNSVEIDEPVSTDIHRLIRFPYSLHGKTGLIVRKIDIDSLKTFEPLSEAIPNIFGDDLIGVRMKKPFEINFNGIHYKLEEEDTVPSNLAIFLSLSGRANIY